MTAPLLHSLHQHYLDTIQAIVLDHPDHRIVCVRVSDAMARAIRSDFGLPDRIPTGRILARSWHRYPYTRILRRHEVPFRHDDGMVIVLEKVITIRVADAWTTRGEADDGCD